MRHKVYNYVSFNFLTHEKVIIFLICGYKYFYFEQLRQYRD